MPLTTSVSIASPRLGAVELLRSGAISMDAAQLLPQLHGRSGQPYTLLCIIPPSSVIDASTAPTAVLAAAPVAAAGAACRGIEGDTTMAEPCGGEGQVSEPIVVLRAGDSDDTEEVELSLMEALLVQLNEPRRKLVVRCLPPAVTEEEFRESILPWEGRISDICFHPGSPPEMPRALPTFACATIRFTLPSAAVDFSAAVDGAPYCDRSGVLCRVLVEWAICQKAPKDTGCRVDAREGTIEKDEGYQAFVQELMAEKPPPMSAEALLETRQQHAKEGGDADGPVVITPLMEYLKQKRERTAAKKREAAALLERKERLRQEQEESRRREELRCKTAAKQREKRSEPQSKRGGTPAMSRVRSGEKATTTSLPSSDRVVSSVTQTIPEPRGIGGGSRDWEDRARDGRSGRDREAAPRAAEQQRRGGSATAVLAASTASAAAGGPAPAGNGDDAVESGSRSAREGNRKEAAAERKSKWGAKGGGVGDGSALPSAPGAHAAVATETSPERGSNAEASVGDATSRSKRDKASGGSKAAGWRGGSRSSSRDDGSPGCEHAWTEKGTKASNAKDDPLELGVVRGQGAQDVLHNLGQGGVEAVERLVDKPAEEAAAVPAPSASGNKRPERPIYRPGARGRGRGGRGGRGGSSGRGGNDVVPDLQGTVD